MKDVSSFARQKKLPKEMVHEVLVQYMMDTNSVTKNYLKERLDPLGLDLITLTKSIMDILSWCVEMYAKYTREED